MIRPAAFGSAPCAAGIDEHLRHEDEENERWHRKWETTLGLLNASPLLQERNGGCA